MTTLITSALTAFINQQSYAAGTQFYCDKSKYQNRTVPATYVRTQDGKRILMLRWVDNDSFPPPWTTQKRCDEVSRRFQRSYDNGTLKYIITGTIIDFSPGWNHRGFLSCCCYGG
ncbi:COP23 domain-containing protein [Pelatocladus sp. BLCC-F211]|uniref:COP23 domain-containing protein n=1 Tax=Pelatocladus sp. BLCC-F211 TaxID=3342752 RepID=UPI0035BB8E71